MDENSSAPAQDNISEVEAVKPEDVFLSAKGHKFLNQTRPWVRFMSILVFISAGLMALLGLILLLYGIAGDKFSNNSAAFDMFPIGTFPVVLTYLLMAVLYIAPGIFLARYATAIKVLESTRTSGALEKALKYQKSFWRYVGILTVAFLVITAALFAFTFAVAFFMYLNR